MDDPKMEPWARDRASAAKDMPTLHAFATVSLAISMKRIADALDAVTTDSRFGIGIRAITNGDDQ